MRDHRAVLEPIIRQFRVEAEEDYVGMWEISRAIESLEEPDQSELITQVVAALLDEPSVVLGQFEGESFVPWPGGREDWIERVRTELRAYGGKPDIGDIGWLALLD